MSGWAVNSFQTGLIPVPGANIKTYDVMVACEVLILSVRVRILMGLPKYWDMV